MVSLLSPSAQNRHKRFVVQTIHRFLHSLSTTWLNRSTANLDHTWHHMSAFLQLYMSNNFGLEGFFSNIEGVFGICFAICSTLATGCYEREKWGGRGADRTNHNHSSWNQNSISFGLHPLPSTTAAKQTQLWIVNSRPHNFAVFFFRVDPT